MTSDKEFFTILGQFKDVPDKEFGQRRAFIPDSPRYYRDRCSKMPLNKRFCARFTSKVATRSSQQLAYHWVIVTYISEHTGFTPEEVHDFIMRKKFGTKTIKIGGYETQVRLSISNRAKMPKYDVVELIEEDLNICQELEIAVPTREELGYIPNKDFKLKNEKQKGSIRKGTPN